MFFYCYLFTIVHVKYNKTNRNPDFFNKFPAILSVGQQLPSKTHKHTQSINNGVIELSRCFPTAYTQGINLHPFWEKTNKTSKWRAKYGSTNTTLNWSSLDQAELHRKTSRAHVESGFSNVGNSLDTEKRNAEPDQMSLLYVKSWKRISSSCWVMDERAWKDGNTEDALFYKRPALHFNAMQYARILHEGFLTTIYVSRFGTSGKKQMPNCVMWS